DRRRRAHQLSYSVDKLLVNILRSDADVDHGCLDLRVSHQLHERRQADAGADHVGGEGMPESMRVGFGDARSLTMMTEQRTETRGCHARSACASFQANEQSRAAVRRTFQTQVMIEQLDRFGSQWQGGGLHPLSPPRGLARAP